LEAYVRAIDRAREALRWFVAGPQPRLLHLRSTGSLREALLPEIDAAQENPESQRPFLFIESSFLGAGDDGWRSHAEELGQEYAALREEGAAQNPPIELPELPQAPSSVTDLAAFGARLESVTKSVGGRLPGVVIVLAPAAVLDVPLWVREVRLLVDAPALAALKWIVLDICEGGTEALAQPAEGGVESTDALPDATAMGATMDALLAGMKSAPPGSEGHRLAGMAGPRQAPPPRKRQPSASAADRQALAQPELAPRGLAGAADGERMRELRIAVLEAARAFEQGRPSEGIQAQLRARDLAVQAGLFDNAALIELSLGAYLLQAGAPEQALSVIEQARERAEQAKAPGVVAQSYLSKAGTLLVLQRPEHAVDAYLAGGRAIESEEGVTSLLAVECYRLAGQVSLGMKRPEAALDAFGRAIAIASEAPADQRAASSAPMAARDLAALYREQGMRDRAEALEKQADEWEAAATEATKAN
jgi:tetratricopeptide (TPR) repeat protein